MNVTVTEDEIKFLAGLGKHAESRGISRAGLLYRYILAAEKRENWGGIDKRSCLKYAHACLDRVDCRHAVGL